ncbi:signal peptidase I [Pedosphaera parvula]|uniref:Signal peptidase I n=1 Tax=Pedosphaera parvula (strain Ellin514) TaxID=320771 RepID=B9XRN0_PEDPL|nr:signal peptidase I [Pedosphaera parvula]EEF57501.1 signal peptidase I [Pedosphaera parvula Ellin514]
MARVSKSTSKSKTKSATNERRNKILVSVALCIAVFGVGLMLLRAFGLLRPFSVPSAAMEPTLVSGDYVMMEGVTYLFCKPRRGDLVVFKTDGIASLPPGNVLSQRVAGSPGETLRLVNGKLLVNEQPVSLQSSTGAIQYVYLPSSYAKYLLTSNDTVTVPTNSIFVLGDNSAASSDSRVWGFVPGTNVLGRVWFRYSPPERVGMVR